MRAEVLLLPCKESGGHEPLNMCTPTASLWGSGRRLEEGLVELTGIGVVVFVVVLFAPALRSVLKSIAYRNRAAGKANVIRARRTSGTPAVGGRRAGRRVQRD